MHTIRRLLLTLAMLALLAGVLAACSGDDDQAEPATETPEIAQTQEANPSATPEPTSTVQTQERSDASEGDMAMESAAEPPPPMPPDSGSAGGINGNTGAPPPGTAPEDRGPAATPDAMTFDDPGTNPFYDTEDDNLSTFAMDVDTASYTLARSYLVDAGQLPPDEAIRPEEFINFFNAGYDSPGSDDAFAIYLDAAPAPFGYDGHYMMRVGIQGRYIAPEDRDPVFLTFVIDVSGSMDREDRLELVKDTLGLLVDELREDDRVAIVVYSNESRVVLQPTSAAERQTILNVIEALQPEGSTNVEHGLRLAYDLAAENLREDENTRIVVLSDGVANVGATGPDAILTRVSDGVEQGITLSTVGFGMGNFNDVLMEQLANDGNGNYHYVDNLRQARRVFVHNLTSTLQVVGYDAKIQVEFNPETVDRYRLIGYENRAIADEDFRDDTVDAGEIGAGHSVTALYEMALESDTEIAEDALLATVTIRYEDADTREVVEIAQPLTVTDLRAELGDTPASFRLHAAAAEFAEMLRGSVWAEDGSYAAVLSLLNDLPEAMQADEDVTELIDLVELAIRYGDQ